MSHRVFQATSSSSRRWCQCCSVMCSCLSSLHIQGLTGNEKDGILLTSFFFVCGLLFCVYSGFYRVRCHAERFFKENRVRTCRHCVALLLVLFALLLSVSLVAPPPPALLPAPCICALVTSKFVPRNAFSVIPLGKKTPRLLLSCCWNGQLETLEEILQ